MKKLSNAWFSIIEILVWIFIFTLGLLSIFLMLQWSVNMDSFSRNEIVAANLSRESLELVKNIRDTNFDELNAWDIINPENYNWDKFEVWKYYMIENDFKDWDFPVKVTELSDFWEGESELSWKMEKYRLYLDDEWRYVYAYNATDKLNFTPTPFIDI